MTQIINIPSLREAPREALRRIRLVASDIDGTMTHNAKLPPSILAAFERLAEAGVEVLPITGRPSGEALGLARYLPTVKHAIAENGATYIVPDAAVEFFQKAPDRARLLQIATTLSELLQHPLELAPDAFCRLGL